MDKIFFATGNEGKLEEMKPKFNEKGITLEQVDVDVPEIDAMDVEKVARQKVEDSFEAAVEQDLISEEDGLIVEDTGFFVDAIGGFPGVEAAFFSRTAGAEKLLNLMKGENNRSASFKTAIAYYKQGDIKIFTGKLSGKISEEKRGNSHPHLPYNSYFIPDHGRGDSLAENEDLKNEEMHRRKAVRKILDWFSDK